jgi:hypothetical protein
MRVEAVRTRSVTRDQLMVEVDALDGGISIADKDADKDEEWIDPIAPALWLPARLGASEALAHARRELPWRLVPAWRARGNSAPEGLDVRVEGIIGRPYWLIYERVARGRSRLHAVDAVSGRRVGPWLKARLAEGLIAGARSTATGSRENCADPPRQSESAERSPTSS